MHRCDGPEDNHALIISPDDPIGARQHNLTLREHEMNDSNPKKVAAETKRYQEEINVIDQRYKVELARADERKQRDLEIAKQRHANRLRQIKTMETLDNQG